MLLDSINLDSSPSDIAYISGLALVAFSAAFGYKLGGSMWPTCPFLYKFKAVLKNLIIICLLFRSKEKPQKKDLGIKDPWAAVTCTKTCPSPINLIINVNVLSKGLNFRLRPSPSQKHGYTYLCSERQIEPGPYTR